MNTTGAGHGAKSGLVATGSTIAAKTLKTFVRNPQLVVITLGQGVLFLLVFQYVFGGAIDAGRLPYIDYMVPGIIIAGMVFAAANTAVGVAEDRIDGFIDRVLSLPTSRTGLVIGRAVADAGVLIAAAVAMVLVAIVMGFRPNAGALDLVAAVGLLALYASTFAAAFAALGTLAAGPQAAQGMGFVAVPITFVSSAYVPVDTMPSWLAIVARNQPVTHMIDAFRSVTQASVIGHDSYASTIAIVSCGLIALSSVAVARRRLAATRGA